MRKSILSEGKSEGDGQKSHCHRVNEKLTASLSFADWHIIIKHLEHGLQIVPSQNRPDIIEAMEELQSELSDTVFFYANSHKHRKLFPEQFIEEEKKEETDNLDKTKSVESVVKVSWWKKLFKKERK